MNPNLLLCCSSLLVLLQSTGAGPASELQSLKRLLEGIDPSRFFSPEQMEQDTDADADQSVFGAPEEERPWEPDPEPGSSALLARLFKDLTRTSKRSWGRSKKGGLRSCFGVRMERIGSFSGLGC